MMRRGVAGCNAGAGMRPAAESRLLTRDHMVTYNPP